LLDWLVAVLQIETAAAAAALALKYLCEDCGQYMQPCLSSLMALYSQALAADVSREHHAAANGHALGLALEEGDVQMLMEAVCLCVCR
jgi:transportin-3